MQERLFFVIGSPRSGSTLLARMLGAHSDVHAPAEPHLLTPLANLGFYGAVEKAPYDPIITQQAARELVRQLPGGEAQYLDALRAYSDAIYSALLADAGAQYLLEKTPAYALELDFIAKLYPKARYVVLTRHPFAIWSSYVESFFAGDHAVAHAHNPLLERYVPALTRFLKNGDVPKHHVRYEELVADPEAQVGAIAKFLGIPFEPNMVNYGEAPGAEKVAARGLGDPVTVARESRPTTQSVSRWMEDIAANPSALAVARKILDGLSDADLEHWGYTTGGLSLELESAAKTAGAPRKRPLDRHALERRLLVSLRRNIHQNAFGRLVRRIRFVCDVLLR